MKRTPAKASAGAESVRSSSMFTTVGTPIAMLGR